MSGRFLTALCVELVGDDVWRLTKPLVYESELLQRTIMVPKNMTTDFASVPRVPFAYLFFGNVAQEAAVVHDALYGGGYGVTRKQADDVFVEASKACGVGAVRRGMMWLGIRAFGGSHYTEKPTA